MTRESAYNPRSNLCEFKIPDFKVTRGCLAFVFVIFIGLQVLPTSSFCKGDERRCPCNLSEQSKMKKLSNFGKASQTLVSESLTKFVELWGSGNSATFHIDCWNGDARFYFSALLGRPEDVKKPESGNKSRQSPSKQKRNQVRLEAFLEKKKRESCLEESVLNLNATTERTVERESCSDESVFPHSTSIEGKENNEREPCSDVKKSLALENVSKLEIPCAGIKLQIERDPSATRFYSAAAERLLRKLDSKGPEDYTEEITKEEELRQVEKDLKEGRVHSDYEDPMSVDDLTQCDGGVFSGEFRGRYVEKEAFKEQDDPIVQEVLMEVFTAQSQFQEIFGREWGSVDRRYEGSLKEYYFVPDYAVRKLDRYINGENSIYWTIGRERFCT